MHAWRYSQVVQVGKPLTAALKTTVVANQCIYIFESHSSTYLFQEFIFQYSNVPHFTPSYNEIVTNIFLLERSILEIGNENWFTAGYTIRQQKNCFTTGCTVSAMSATSLPSSHSWQRLLTHCRQLNSSSKLQIRCIHYNVGSESQIRYRTHNIAANVNSLLTFQFQ
jgi:endonuclease/exonuclease/phosphatase family metal-dependent hydrolase